MSISPEGRERGRGRKGDYHMKHVACVYCTVTSYIWGWQI